MSQTFLHTESHKLLTRTKQKSTRTISELDFGFIKEYTLAGCLSNILFSISRFSRFFSQFFGCFSRFFGKRFACFQGSSKKFHQISTYRFRNFRTNLNIRRFSDTKMGDFCKKLSFQGFQGFPVKNTCFSRFSRPPGLISRFSRYSRFSRSGSHPA